MRGSGTHIVAREKAYVTPVPRGSGGAGLAAGAAWPFGTEPSAGTPAAAAAGTGEPVLAGPSS